MAANSPVTETWLTDLLSELGNTSDEIAAKLRDARVQGYRQDARRCPLARFVTERLSEHYPSGSVEVVVATDALLIAQASPDANEGGDLLVLAELSEPVVEFVQRFDDAAWPDLINEAAE
jgi:hypothetical protein